MNKQKEKMDLGLWLKDNELSLQGVTDSGNPVVKFPDGDVGELNLKQVQIDTGFDPENTETIFNSADTPLEKSPVGLMDRFKLEFGNEKGSIKFLKNKFEDVKAHPDHGLVVKDKGVWHQVDPTGVGSGDPWEMAKELVSDVAELSTEAIDTGAGLAGVAAGAPAGPAGAIGGSVLASGLAAKGRLSLGRYLGTYDATPEDELRDVAFEAMLGLGGEVVGAGAKLGGKQIAKFAKKLNDTAEPTVKQAMSSMLGFFTGARKSSVDALISNPNEVVKESDKILTMVRKKHGTDISESTINEVTRNAQLDWTNQAFKSVPRQIGKKFDDAMENTVFNNANINNFRADVAMDLSEAVSELEANGVIKAANSGKAGTPPIYEVTEDLVNSFLEDPQTATLAAKNGVKKKLNTFIDQLNSSMKAGTLKGKPGARKVKELRSALNEVYYDAIAMDNSNSKALKQLLGGTRAKISNSLSSNFDKVGLGEQFRSANKIYADNVDLISEMRRVSKTPQRLEAFLNSKKVSDGNILRRATDQAQGMSKAALKRVELMEHAKDFTLNVPNPKMLAGGQGLLGAGAISAAATGNVPLAIGLGTAFLGTASRPAAKLTKTAINASSIPRDVARAGLAPARKTLDFVRALSPGQRLNVLSDPELFGNIFGNMINVQNMGMQEGEDETR